MIRTTAAHHAVHLTAGDLQDQSASCPICRFAAAREPVFELQKDPTVALLACPRCRASSASHMPTAAFLDRYYGDYYGDKAQKVTFEDVDHFGRYLFKSFGCGAELGRHVRILDFGGGDGSVGRSLCTHLLSKQSGRAIDFTLVDFQPPALPDAPGVRVHHVKRLDELDGEFDLVIASAILEHIPGLHGVFQKLFDSVAASGYFYARTPYAVPLTRIIRGLDLTFPAHVHDLGCGFWNRVAEIFGFDADVVATRPSIVESALLRDPLRALAAHVLKLPARVEGRFSPAARKDRFWRLVGGWEVVLRRRARAFD